jgi:hypothetical protein
LSEKVGGDAIPIVEIRREVDGLWQRGQIQLNLAFFPDDDRKVTLRGETGKQDFGIEFPIENFDRNSQTASRFGHE